MGLLDIVEKTLQGMSDLVIVDSSRIKKNPDFRHQRISLGEGRYIIAPKIGLYTIKELNDVLEKINSQIPNGEIQCFSTTKIFEDGVIYVPPKQETHIGVINSFERVGTLTEHSTILISDDDARQSYGGFEKGKTTKETMKETPLYINAHILVFPDESLAQSQIRRHAHEKYVIKGDLRRHLETIA